VSRFEPKTFTFILQRIINRAIARTRLTDANEGGVIHTIAAGTARELDDINYQMSAVQSIWDINSAQGEDLDARGEDYNPDKIVRNSGSAATVGLVFGRTGTTGAVAIAVGSIARVPSGQAFETIAAGTIADGFSVSGSVSARATSIGTQGNVVAATITQLDAITGVETVTNPVAALGGQDAESDAEFRERIKLYLRSLSRGTPTALKYAALSAFLEDYGGVVSAEVVELNTPNLGTTYVYIDDGAGTVEIGDDNVGSPETVIGTATGGEVRLQLDNWPLQFGSAVVLERNAALLVENTDYTVNRSNGQVTLDSTVFPSGLTVGDTVTAEYYWWEGLIEETQLIIEGNPADRTNYPGYRAGGTLVYVLPPTVLQQVIAADAVIEDGFLSQATAVRTAVADAVNRYINGLGVNGDVILSELIFHAQSVAGIADVTFTSPTANVIIGEGQLARVTAANISIT
jgi:uncharacterized phage protein gp47/JayE